MSSTSVPMELPPPLPPPKQTNKKLSYTEENKLISKCQQQFDQCSKVRTQFERDWYYNMAFYFGRQWVEWVGTSSGNFDLMKLYEPPAPKWRARIISNKIRPIIRRELTKLTKEKVEFYVMPRSTEELDVAAAKAANMISEFLFSELRFQFIRRQATFWALLCGSSFIKDFWDPYQTDLSGQQGAIQLECVNAFHLFVPDLQNEDIEQQPYVIHAMAKDPGWVETTYDNSVPPDVSSVATSLEQKFFSALGLSQQNTSPLVYVKEAWYKPCKDYPEGAVITWANSKLLSYTPYWPYTYRDFPFSKIDHIPTGRFYADSVIKDLIPIQKEYNRTRSQLIEAKNRMAKPQLIAPRGSVDPEKITSEPGLIILYTPGFQPPQPIPLTQMPQYVMEELDRCQRDMDDISAQTEVSKGRTPPGVEAASAIAYLQEENDTRLFHTVASIEDAVEKVGRHLLTHADSFWDEQRLVRVSGLNNIFEAKMFSKADIAGSTDFRVEAGSAAPRSRAAKQAFLTEIGKLGWVPPDKLLKYLDMAETNRLYDDSQISIRQAQRENINMTELGQPLPVNDFDDDLVHDQEHTNYMRSQEFEVLNPQVKQVHMLHLQSHRARMAGGMQQQQPQSQPQPEQAPAIPQGNGAPQ